MTHLIITKTNDDIVVIFNCTVHETPKNLTCKKTTPPYSTVYFISMENISSIKTVETQEEVQQELNTATQAVYTFNKSSLKGE